MANMQVIKRRIRSVESTKKITKAMELVATSKLRRSRNQLESLKPYYTTIQETMAKILENEIAVQDHPLLKKSDNPACAYVIITSQLGLCGGYNAAIIKETLENVKVEDQIFVIGTKGYEALKKTYPHISIKYMHFYQNMDYNQVVLLGKDLLELYSQHQVGSIKIIYTEFINNLKFVPRVVTLLPVKKEDFEVSSMHQDIIFEPNPAVVLDHLIPIYLNSLIYGYIIESMTSENASRRTSMENANDNAEELIDHLLLKYNQARQAAITNEITEIVAGANVQ